MVADRTRTRRDMRPATTSAARRSVCGPTARKRCRPSARSSLACIAQVLPAATTMTILAATSLAVTAILSPGLRLSDARPAPRQPIHRENAVALPGEAAV